MQLIREFTAQFAVGAWLSFLLLLYVVTLPLLVVHYRRFGRVAKRRAAALYLLVIYGSFVVALTLFPLPDPGTVQCAGVNFQPFAVVGAIASQQASLSISAVLSNAALFQYVYNIALFVPLGVILRRAYRAPILTVAAAGLVVSLLVELTQLTGVWGFYSCPYRVFDVDDIIANVAGAVLGGLLAPLMLGIPRNVRATPAAKATNRVTVLHRAVATGIDTILAGLLGYLLGAAVALLFPAITGLWTILPPAVVVFVLVPTLTSGSTPGKWLVRLRIRNAGNGEAVPWYRLLSRMAVLVLPWFVLYAGVLFAAEHSGPNAWVTVVAMALGLLTVCYPALPAGTVALRSDRRGFHDLLAGTQVEPVSPKRPG